MAPTWHETDNLLVDRDGILWRAVRTDEDTQWRRLGPIEAAEVPGALEGEHARLLDLWLDGFDDRAEQLGAYRRAVGAP